MYLTRSSFFQYFTFSFFKASTNA